MVIGVGSEMITLPISDLPISYGEQMMDEVIAEPTLDRYLDRAPKLLEPKDIRQLCIILRHKRELFIKAEQDKKSKKEDLIDDEG